MMYEIQYELEDKLTDVFFDAADGHTSLDAYRATALGQALIATCNTMGVTARLFASLDGAP